MDDSRRYLDPRVLNRVSRLDLRARLIVERVVSGRHRSPHKGFSVEFAEHREYAPGDDLRYLDWKVYGKSDRLYVKQYEEETNLVATGGDEVGLLLVLLHVEAVGLAVDLPVEVAEVVARRVLAVLRELHGEPLVRAPVPPRDDTLDDQPCAEVQPRDAVEDPRVQVPAGVVHRSGSVWGGRRRSREDASR